ncbi:MAG: amidohydrolase family protein [Bacteroidetes bacterium]|nr:amidohydrolase family protein [Bacteroidota bacterium]
MKDIIQVDTYFDGDEYFSEGPYFIIITEESIEAIVAKKEVSDSFLLHTNINLIKAAFAMPGLAEGHAHLFLAGEELDFKKRSSYLKSDLSTFIEVGKENLRKSLESGITLVRDAGDIHGVNTILRNGSNGSLPRVRSAGKALRKKGRYGSFMGVEVESNEDFTTVIEDLAVNADELKILLTGIIDFERGEVKGVPQFELNELKQISTVCKKLNIRNFVHCSGKDGLELAIDVGINSIEHGFFMEEQMLTRMCDKNMEWVPTFSPLHFQLENPKLAGWNQQSQDAIRAILDNHYKMVGKAGEIGLHVIPGSDAGSYGVEHGKALLQEIVHLVKAGLPLLQVLHNATILVRKKWDYPLNHIRKGSKESFVLMDKDPFTAIQNIYSKKSIILGSPKPALAIL